MKDPKTFVIPEVGKSYGKGLKSLFFTFWVLAAFAGIAIAFGLGLARNDWVIVDSDVSEAWQGRGELISQIAAYGAGGILILYGLLRIFRKRQWLLVLPCAACALAFPTLLYLPQWVPFAFGGGAMALGVLVLKMGDRNERKAAAQNAATSK